MPCFSGPDEQDEYIKNHPPTKEQLERERQREENRKAQILNKADYTPLEREAFSSFMAAFLCKAMDIIAAKDMMKYTYEDMEWWWNEHRYRDNNNNKRGKSKQEIESKLEQISERYGVK